MESSYDVFVSHEETTGLDLAKHLKEALEKRRISTFVADLDLPKSVANATEWRSLADKVIYTTKTFLLILSSPKLSPEVVRETQLAFKRSESDTKFSIIICHCEGIPRAPEQLLAAGIDASNFQQVDFDTKEKLAREANIIIDDQGFARHPPVRIPTTYFEDRMASLLTPLIDNGKPMMQIVVGPIARSDNILEVTKENARLFCYTPRFLQAGDVTTRRDWYEFDPELEDRFLRIYSDGFFHSYFPFHLKESQKNASVQHTVFYLSGFLFFVLRIMKHRSISAILRIHVELTGLRDLNVTIGSGLLSRFDQYSFSKNERRVVYEKDTNTSDKWSKALLVVCDIYKDICRDLGIIDITDDTVRNNVKKIVDADQDLRTQYSNDGIVIPIVDLKEVFS